jgi:hypothetical protein
VAAIVARPIGARFAFEPCGDFAGRRIHASGPLVGPLLGCSA